MEVNGTQINKNQIVYRDNSLDIVRGTLSNQEPTNVEYDFNSLENPAGNNQLSLMTVMGVGENHITIKDHQSEQIFEFEQGCELQPTTYGTKEPLEAFKKHLGKTIFLE